MELVDLLPLLREKCPGVIDALALAQLKKAYRNFCVDSGFLLREEALPVDATRVITLTPDAGHYVTEVLTVDDKATSLLAGTDYRVGLDQSVVTIAEGHDLVTVNYAIAPQMPIADGQAVEAELLQRWPEEITSGAAALLRMMPDQEWTSPNLADYYQRDYVKGHREAYRARAAAIDNRQLQPAAARRFF